MVANRQNFICGVVEGFYGRPWTTEQRKDLFRRIETMGLNSYVYAPKDDLKHRAYWRDLYTVEEADHLQGLIEAAKQHNVCFYYALSPGLDICYSSQKEVNAIKQKLQQVRRLGCEWFALLFDDIEAAMCDADKQKFSSFADAQVTVTNEIFEYLGQPSFMFCPTEYCESRAVPNLENSEYLNFVGKKLAPEIHVMWTGQRVISRHITVEHLTAVRQVLKRKPIIWDNLHANDYDNKRVFLGPYAGRSALIKFHISGVVINPNCEFEANYVAMHTLAQWNQCYDDAAFNASFDAALEMGGDEKTASAEANAKTCSTLYHPLNALKLALDAWLPEISAPRNAFITSKVVPPSNHQVIAPETTPNVNAITCTCTSITSTTLPGAANVEPSFVTTTVDVLPPYVTSASISGDNGDSGVETVNSTSLTTITPSGCVQSVTTSRSLSSESCNNLAPPGTTTLTTQSSALTAALNAVNSLTDEYSEPMELAMLPVSSSSTLSSSSAASSTQAIAGSHTRTAISDTLNGDEQEAADTESTGHVEMMDSTSHSDQGEGADEATEADMATIKTVSASDRDMATIKSASINVAESEDVICSDQSPAYKAAGDNSSVPDDGVATMQVDGGCQQPSGYQGTFEAPSPLGGAVLRRADLQLMADFFYLPFEHGPTAHTLLNEFVWLKANSTVIPRSRELGFAESADEWNRRASDFDSVCKTVIDLCVRLVACANRGFVYDLYPYIWELQGMLNCLNSYIKWLACGHIINGQCQKVEDLSLVQNGLTDQSFLEKLTNLEGEPWLIRGGLMAECQRLLPLETTPDLFLCRPPHPPCGRIFKARPFLESDRRPLYELCKSTVISPDGRLDLNTSPEVIGDRYAGAFIDLCREFCFVCEEMNETAGDVVGFALACMNAQRFRLDCKQFYIPKLKRKYDFDKSGGSSKHQQFGLKTHGQGDSVENGFVLKDYFDDLCDSTCRVYPQSLISRYPSLVFVRLKPDLLDTPAPKRLLVALFAALKTHGSTGVFCEIRKNDRITQDLYNRLGFFEISMLDDSMNADGFTYFGRIL